MTTNTQIPHHNLYVIELDKDVLQYDKFAEANPQYKEGMPCLYVGLTKHTPEKRFNYHLVGYKSEEFVRRYARRLRPELFTDMNPMPYEKALLEEPNLANRLRSMGYAVWEH